MCFTPGSRVQPIVQSMSLLSQEGQEEGPKKLQAMSVLVKVLFSVEKAWGI